MAISTDTANGTVHERPAIGWGSWAFAGPLILVFLLALLVPFVSNDYWVLIATRAAIYWVLVGRSI